MKTLITTILLSLFSYALYAVEPLTIDCMFFGTTEEEAVKGAAEMVKSISENAVVQKITTNKFKTKDGKEYWVADIIITIEYK